MIDAKGFGTTQEANAEREAALTGYKDAEDKLASIDNEQGTPTKQDISRAARAILATTQYERSQFLARIGDTAGADQARKTAIDTIKQIKEENWPLPAVMAPELAEAAGIMPIAPTTRPGAGPTTGPTTAPATASAHPHSRASRRTAGCRELRQRPLCRRHRGAQGFAVNDPVTTQVIATMTRVMGAIKKVHDAMVSKFGDQASRDRDRPA